MVDVFISYKREDRLKAQAIAEALTKHGYSVWWDTELLPGDKFAEEIKTIIDNAKTAIVLWSELALKSHFVIAEASAALKNDILIPARLDNCEPPLPFGIIQTLDLRDWAGSSDDSLLDPIIFSIKKKINYVPTPIQSDQTVQEILKRPTEEVVFWKSVSEQDPQEIKEYQLYVSRYGQNAIFSELAIARIEKLNNQQHEAERKKTPQRPNGNSRTLIFTLLLVALLVAGVLWYFATKQRSPLLSIKSDPSGALVYVDDGEVGSSPVQISELSSGTHTVLLLLDKYEPYKTQVFLQQDNPVDISLILTPEPYGDLIINSQPEGANVLIDGMMKGNTPLNIFHLLQGTHNVKLNHPDYVTWKGKVIIEPAETTKLHQQLTTAYGILELTSTPNGARVKINNNDEGTTPYKNKQLRIGEYNITLEKQKFGSWSTKTFINPGDVTAHHAELVLVYGSLSVTSEAKGADVFVDNKLQGKAPLELSLLEGKHEIEVRQHTALFAPWHKKVKIVAGKSQSVIATFKYSPTYTDATTGMEFVYVPGGCYQMGDTFGDGELDEQPVHEVCVDGFYLGKYEVTQGEYTKVIGFPPSTLKKGSRYPVENVSWDDAQAYVSKLSNQSGKKYRLPTEAEWEYAARSGGKEEIYSGGNSVESVAWYEFNSDASPHKVGTKEGNSFGLYDMSGNVWEWCSDWYGADYYSSSPPQNPKGPFSGKERVMRGGRWSGNPERTRSANRGRHLPYKCNHTIGYRLVLQADVPNQ